MKLSDENIEYFTEGTRMKAAEMVAASKELEIRRQLERYCIQTHPVTCEYYQNPFSAVCTCGLSDLLSKLKELEGV